MKKMATLLTLCMGLTAQASDFARVKCEVKIDGNKSEFKGLRKSQLPDIAEELYASEPGVPHYINVRRIFPLPKEENYKDKKDFHQAQLRSLAKNRVILFAEDGDSIAEARKDKDLEQLMAKTFETPFTVKMKYRSTGSSLSKSGMVVGPRIIVSGTTVRGGQDIDVYALKGNEKKEFEVKGEIIFDYTKVDKGGFLGFFGIGDYKTTDESKIHRSKINIKCEAHLPTEVVEEDRNSSSQKSDENKDDDYNYSLPGDLKGLEVIKE